MLVPPIETGLVASDVKVSPLIEKFAPRVVARFVPRSFVVKNTSVLAPGSEGFRWHPSRRFSNSTPRWAATWTNSNRGFPANRRSSAPPRFASIRAAR